MKGYGYQKSSRKLGAYHAAHVLRYAYGGSVFPRHYDSDNPIRRLHVEGQVNDMDKLCAAIGGAWVLDQDGHLLLYAREHNTNTVADVLNEFGKVDAVLALQAFNNEIRGMRSPLMEQNVQTALARVHKVLTLQHIIAGDHPHLRDWGHGTAAEIVLHRRNGLMQCGGIIFD